MTGNSPEAIETPLKILMTTDAVGGVWQYSVDLMTGVVRRGAKVLLASMGPRPSGEQKQRLLALPGVTLIESDYALEWMSNPWRDVDLAGEWLLNLASDFNPTLIHLNGYAHASLPWRRPVVVTAHSCVYSWWRAVHGFVPGDDWTEYKRRLTAGLAAADAIIAPSAFMAGALSDEYGVPSEKIQVVHNFSRAPQSSVMRKQPFSLAAGRLWDPAKNISLLEQIAGKLDWEIRVAGSDRGPDVSIPATKRVRFLGPLSHNALLSELERATLFLHPALYEPFGLAVLEAASRRCCLVLSDLPSLRELWSDAALFLNPRDPEQWIFEINHLIRNPARQQALAQFAFARSKKYRASAGIAQYWHLYRSVLQAKNSAKKGMAA